MAGQHTFRTTLFRGGEAVNSSTFAAMEFDARAAFGSAGRIPVKGTLNGFAFSGTLMPYGGRHLLTVNKAIQTGARAAAGDEVEITIARDDAKREIEPPADLRAALRADKAASAAWKALAYSHQRQHVLAIEEARRPETRARRIEQTLAMLLAGTHRKS